MGFKTRKMEMERAAEAEKKAAAERALGRRSSRTPRT